jgi:hypothetical protein
VGEPADASPDLERFLAAATPAVAPPAGGPQDLRMVRGWGSAGLRWAALWSGAAPRCSATPLGAPGGLGVLCRPPPGLPPLPTLWSPPRAAPPQADLWRWFEGPSIVGREVATLGGPRGPASAYYLPYLSAVQLFEAAGEEEEEEECGGGGGRGGQAEGAAPLLAYPDGLESWPARMRPLVQWGERANMRDRVPLHPRLAQLAGDRGEQHPLLAARLADLHPLSW